MVNMGYDLNNILITGASGYIGNYFYENLKKKYNCIPLSKSKKKVFININLLDNRKLKTLSKKISPTLIIHFANKLPNTNNFNENYQMTKNILNTFNCPIIFISSMTVYNSLKKTNLNEKLKIRLNKKKDKYAYYKFKTERLISKRKINGDISIRIPGVFGGERKSGLIYGLINSLKKKIFFKVEPFDGNWSAIHIHHLYKLILKLIETKNNYKIKIINIAYNNLISIPLAIKIIENFFNKKIDLICSTKFKKTKIETKEYEKRFSKINFTFRQGLNLELNKK